MSLAMVLLLTLAVTQIFRVTVTTIGKGNATGEVVRGMDAARIALQIDFSGTDSITYSGFTDQSGILPTDRQPAIIISSTAAPAFMSERDMESDSDYDPATGAGVDTIDADNNGVDDTLLGPYRNGRRWFRLDSLSFFTGGHGESQKNLQPTGGGYYGDTTGDESWVWYGHGRLYDGQGELNQENTNQYPLPGEGTRDTNPHNFFANQFVLLRSAIICKPLYDHDGDSATEITATNDAGGPTNEILFVRPTWDPAVPSAVAAEPEVGPFNYLTQVNLFTAPTGPNEPYPTADPYEIQDSRVDVAGVTVAQYRERLSIAQRYDSAAGGNPNDANGPLSFGAGGAAAPPTWYNRLFARTTSNPLNSGRFWINSQVLKPLDAGEVSQASSYLLGGASEFIVEYAGDFLTQLPTGAIDTTGINAGLAPDGVIDFTIDASGTRHIRFYGMPRDVDGVVADDAGATYLIPGPAATAAKTITGGPVSTVLLTSTDTRPLADYLPAAGTMNVNTGFPFEKRLPGNYTGTPELPTGRDTVPDYGVLAAADFDDFTYLAAWGPADFDGATAGLSLYGATFTTPANPEGKLRPSLIRVIVSGIDREHRLEEPLSMELIFRVPAE